MSGLHVGGNWYDQAELLAVMNTPTEGNAAIILAYQLIAAKLNNHVVGYPYELANLIDAADDLLDGRGELGDLQVSPACDLGAMMVAIAWHLEALNTTPDCADPYDGPGA